MSRWGISRIGVVAVVGWAVAVVLAGSIAWRAVTVIDTETTASGVLTQAQVLDALAQVRATAGPATPAPTPTPSPDVPTAPEVVRTWTVTGGTVATSCRDTAITLLYATPVDGWKVEVKAAGPDEVVVELEGADQEVTLRAACVAGVPEQQLVEGSDEESGEETSSPAPAGGVTVTPTPDEGSDEDGSDDGSADESPESDQEDGSDD